MARTAVAPDGVHWRVGRRWLPFRVRLRRDNWRDAAPTDFGDLALFDSPGGVLAGLALTAAVILLLLVIWPIVAIALEVVLVALILIGAVGGRVILRRPWTVVARSEREQEHSWRVAGWRRSGRLIDEIAESLESGRALPPGAT
jgi:hypothetical protein